MIKYWFKIIIFLNVLYNNVCKNTIVWWHDNSGVNNFGDELNPYIISKLTNNKVVKAGSLWNRFDLRRIYIGIGSVITKANKNTIVWGAGIITRDQKIRRSIYTAVRGPLTQNRLRECGIEPPSVIGDPALLLPLVYKSKQRNKYSYGIIPHIIDFHLFKNKFKSDSHIVVIDFTAEIEKIIDVICSCEIVFSSSLHGIITANAYLIPVIWCEFSKNLSGDDVKFYDYIMSVKEDERIEKEIIDVNTLDIEILNNLKQEASIIFPKKEDIEEIQNNLIYIAPFKIKENLSFS